MAFASTHPSVCLLWCLPPNESPQEGLCKTLKFHRAGLGQITKKDIYSTTHLPRPLLWVRGLWYLRASAMCPLIPNTQKYRM